MTDATQEPEAAEANAGIKAEAFTFGDPEPVLDRRSMLGLDHMECWRNAKWYEPPVSMIGLSRSTKATPHHGSAMLLKVNLLTSSFIPHRLLSRRDFEAMALDYIVLGNGYLEQKVAVTGRPMKLQRTPAKYTRRGVDLEQYFFLPETGPYGSRLGAEHEFEKGSIVHILAPDVDQEIYGTPEYLCALQSAWLNEAATIFRRRYYKNGSHAGFILYSTDSQLDAGDVDTIRTALKESKGPGNFRNLFLHAPGGKKDGIQLIPVSEVAAKDEFMGIKNTSRDDVLAAHRVPPQLLGIVPSNAGGFGDVAKATDVFHRLEITPLQTRFLAINDLVGEEVVKFTPWDPMSVAKGANDDGPRSGRHAA